MSDFVTTKLDWKKAERHLRTAERCYTEIGPPGVLALALVIAPCRGRFNDGERTQELHDEIMGISL